MKIFKLKGKKRYLAAAFIAMEITSIPVAAQMVHKVAFQVHPTVTAVEIPTSEAGVSRFFVLSNAPFTIRSADMVGDMDISVRESGEINGNRFGSNAQLPGPQTACAAVTNPFETVIYQAARKTAAKRGNATSQAVVIEVKYDNAAAPKISFAKDGAAPAAASSPCSATVS